MGAIVLSSVSKVYKLLGQPDVVALQAVDLEVADGEFLALVGPSGCGKSTLLHLVGGFLQPDTGSIRHAGQECRRPGPDRGVVFQEFALFPWLTVLENVMYGLREQHIPMPERAARAHQYLEMTNLAAHEGLYPKQLSGGMKQRVAIARALACNPTTLLMDEPFGSLDAHTRTILQDELQEIWAATGKTVLFVTHSVDEAIFLSDRIAVMSGRPGRIREVVSVDLPRPRRREQVMRTSRYSQLHEYIWQQLQEEWSE